MTRPIRVRFAPSPTGLLHIGSAHTALFSYLFARKEQGKFLLRIEDTDTKRSRQEWVDAIFEVLDWLELDWDEDVVYQSQRIPRYQERANELLDAGKAYRCYYLPEELDARKQAALKEGKSWRNDRRYADISETEREALEAAGRQAVVRLMIPEGKTIFQDRILGEIVVDNSTIDDFVIVRSNGSPLYHLAVVTDDIDMEISHVIRGMDHVTNTSKHVQLFQAFGYDLPEFGHLPNILGQDKKKLSKRHGAVSVSEYRDAGYLSDAVVNFLSLLGWQTGDDQEFFKRAALMKRFSLDQVHKRDTVFDVQKFEWLNGQHIMALSDEAIYPMVAPLFVEAGFVDEEDVTDRQAFILLVISLLKERCRTLTAFVVQGKFFFVTTLDYNPKAVRKHWAKEPNAVIQRLRWLRDGFKALDPFDVEAVEGSLRQLAEQYDLKPAQFIHPCRVALTGEMAGPSLFHLIAALGQDVVIERLEQAIHLFPEIIKSASAEGQNT
jgi:glutamyl-tRNA synthetase